MQQSGIQAKINLGYAKAASRLGASFTQYRPTDPLVPLGNMLGTLMADFDVTPTFTYRGPGTYGKPLYYGLFDGTNVQVFDYLISGQRTFFVAGYEPNKPMLCVECNEVISIGAPDEGAPSPTGYMGLQGGCVGPDGGPNAVMRGWPASVLQGYRGSKGDVGLPSDVRMPWYSILLPSFPGVTIAASYRITDRLGRNMTVSSCEITDLGWRLSAELADT